jgi:hypothetical protein
MKLLSVAVAATAIAMAEIAHAGVLHGTVVEQASGQPVAGAVITVGSELAASGDDGTFEIELAPGAYTAVVTADWLEPANHRIVISDGRTEVTISVRVRAAPSGETIEISDIAPTAVGDVRVDAALARTVPGGGDAGKIVQSLPAVARPSTGTTEVVVWGAAPRDTRIFVDGVPVPTLYHVGGYRSAVGNDLIGDVRLAPAAFGPERGRAIGGVIEMGLADPTRLPQWRFQADVLDGSAVGRTTLGPATVAAAIRYSWLDRAVAAVEDPRTLAPNAPLPRWSDAQVVARVPIRHDLVLSAWALGSIDTLNRTLASDDPGTETSEHLDRNMVRAQLSLRRERPHGWDLGTVWWGRDRSVDDLRVGAITATASNAGWVGGARGVQSTKIGDSGPTLTLGVDVDAELATLHRIGSLSIPAREGDPHIFGQPPGDDVASDRWKASTIDAAGHASLDTAFGPVVTTLGLRTDAWLLTASRLTPRIGATPNVGAQDAIFTVDPRGSVRVRISDGLDARADAGLYHQSRAASDTSAVFGTPTLGVERAWHVIAGGQWRRAPLALEAAGYARWLEDLVARDLAVTPKLAQVLTQQGIGRVIGIQVTARLIGWHGVSGWLSYNVSRSERKDATDQPWRLFDRDQTHGLIAVASWNRGPWTLGGRVRLATGEPRTPVIGAFFDSRSGRYQPIRGEHNGTRVPTYFAADLRAERTWPLGAIRGAVYVEIQNLTGRANAEELIYSADFAQRGYLTGLPLLAIAGLRIERRSEP